jgi:ATP-dependent Clp protease ATP-binding subunit ClpC
VREQPFGVVLLDEVEKADSGVHDLLLQVLGEGRVSDDAGHTVSFRNTIVLLTSNLGADSVGRSIGFGGGGAAAHDAHYRAAAARFFRPELLNRFDQIVPYRPLSTEVVGRLARKALAEALGREGLLERGVTVEFDDAVVARLAELGFDARLGARPLKRAVETHVVAPLARLLARSAVHPASRLHLVVGEGGRIEITRAEG